MPRPNGSLRFMVTTALFSAIICVLAPWSIPVGAVPVSLATFAVCLTASVTDWRQGVCAAVLYVAIGAVGIPVFAGFAGGVERLLGVTGGYIVGYIPMALVVGMFAGRSERRRWLLPAGMVAGHLLLYAVGTVWFVAATGSEWLAALGACVLPFLPGDALKIAAASLLAFPLRKLLRRNGVR